MKNFVLIFLMAVAFALAGGGLAGAAGISCDSDAGGSVDSGLCSTLTSTASPGQPAHGWRCNNSSWEATSSCPTGAALGTTGTAGQRVRPALAGQKLGVHKTETGGVLTFFQTPKPLSKTDAANPLSPKALLGNWWCSCGYFGCNVVCVAGDGLPPQEIISNHQCPGSQPTTSQMHCPMGNLSRPTGTAR